MNQTINGKREGLWEEYTGYNFHRFNYKNGKLDGLYEVYEKGNIYERCNYKDGKLDGLYEDYYPNGNIKYQSFFKEGKYLYGNGFISNTGILNRNR
jgi:antitoxin component YwqK of YwqJK toxin-antitoxin module